uniref:DUF1279 domain-containing protein n=1 Tax=Clastoptera arizonana TaxID=38151 RepID=A0A1B6DDW0_9HEMI
MSTFRYSINRCLGNVYCNHSSRRLFNSRLVQQIFLNKHFINSRTTQSTQEIYPHKICNIPQLKLHYPLYTYHVKFISTETPSENPENKKLTLYQRLKAMYKDYWYVLLPVHLITSACWYGGFYYMAKSGVDIVAILESLNISEKFIKPLREGHSTTGYLAIAYALYKIFTPLRYTVTLGGTTISINYLKHWGYIKPMPSKEQLKVMYKEKKESFQEKRQEMKDKFEEKKQEVKDNVLQKFKDIDGKKKL